MARYIHQSNGWRKFYWNAEQVANQLAAVRHRQGMFQGIMLSIGLRQRELTTLESLTDEVQKSSEIEGEYLDRPDVRSSIASRLGIEAGGLRPTDRKVEGVVEMVLDATMRSNLPLTAERLFGWHAALFPTGRSNMWKIRVAMWRDDANGPMQVISGGIGAERVHYEAPDAARLEEEMSACISWFEASDLIDPVLKAAIAHMWFVMIHPFDDGNGPIARAIADLALARSEEASPRFYSMSAQILKEKKAHYDVLEKTGKGNLDITLWITWFLGCLDRALARAEGIIEASLARTRFWDSLANVEINERQRLMLGKLLDGFQGKLTTTKWAKIAKCSHDTALRDIQDLIQKGILEPEPLGGRSTSYKLQSIA